MFMFPLEGDNPTRHAHYVVWSIIVLCLLTFVASTFIGARSATLKEWGYIPVYDEPLKIFSSMFLHSGRWHIFGNVIFLWMFGDNI